MADEIRRSGRANKGHHTKNADALDEPVPKPKQKPGKVEKKAPSVEKSQPPRAESEQSGDNDEEENAIIRCVCGDQRDIRGRQMICCDKCEVWQHNQCLNLPEGEYWDNRSYFCEQCKPEEHVDLLAAMSRGEKPWNKKKGRKPPKSRPSDVKTEVKQETPKGTTPQAQTPTQASASTPTQAPPQAPTQASAPSVPAPISVPKDTSQQASNGQADTKPSKKETPIKSQPQSPLGEKRRLESAEKDTSNKKRRKSSAPNVEKAGSQPTIASDIDALPAKQKGLVEKLRETLASLINAASDSRGYRIPDGETAKSLAIRFALQIDHAAILRHGEPTSPESPYTLQMRSIWFNVKKNAILIDRLLSGSLTAEDLASMAPEEMASEEKQREYAAIREANEKQMVLTEETGPRLRKTHKGEEIVGEDDVPDSTDFRAPPLRDRESIPDANPTQPQSPGGVQTAVELPDDLSRRAPLAVDTSSGATDGARRPSTTFDINSVYDKVRSPHNEQQAFVQRRQSSIRAPERAQQGSVVDADIDRLLKDEDNDTEMSGYRSDPSIVWQGNLNMQHLERFDAVARFVAGGDFGQVVPWDKLLPSSLPIQGRIENKKGDEYIQGLGSSGTHDVCVLALSPVTPEGRAAMDQLYEYFYQRSRWGVVPVDGNDVVRDLYVIPVPPGGSNLPPFLDMLEHCTIETPRKEPMTLLALVAKLPEVKPQLPPAQPFERYPAAETAAAQAVHPVQPTNGPTNGPGPSPSPLTNPHGPQYSPVGSSFPPAQNFGNHYAPPPNNNGHAQQPPVPNAALQSANPKAVEILGPFINTPVITHILQSDVAATMSEDQMVNLRHIMEHVPEARLDLNVLSSHLAQKMAATNGQA